MPEVGLWLGVGGTYQRLGLGAGVEPGPDPDPPPDPPPVSGDYPWTTAPTSSFASLLRPVGSYPDALLGYDGGGRFHTFGDLVRVPAATIRATHGLTTMTEAQVLAAAGAAGPGGVVENFYLKGRLRPDARTHGRRFRHFVIDGPPNLYGIDVNTWPNGSRPSRPDRADWPVFEDFVIRGCAAQDGWNGADRTGAGIYGSWFIADRGEAYAAKTVGVKLQGGSCDVRRFTARWIHRVSGDHGGGSQIVAGLGGLKTFRDVHIDGVVRWQDGAELVGAAGLDNGAAGWQTGSLSSAIDYLLHENCYYNSGGTAFRGTASTSSSGGWSSGAFDPDGYVKDYGWFANVNPRFGRDANSKSVAGSETTVINPRYADNGAPL